MKMLVFDGPLAKQQKERFGASCHLYYQDTRQRVAGVAGDGYGAAIHVLETGVECQFYVEREAQLGEAVPFDAVHEAQGLVDRGWCTVRENALEPIAEPNATQLDPGTYAPDATAQAK